jgi:hypothetical protein
VVRSTASKWKWNGGGDQQRGAARPKEEIEEWRRRRHERRETTAPTLYVVVVKCLQSLGESESVPLFSGPSRAPPNPYVAFCGIVRPTRDTPEHRRGLEQMLAQNSLPAAPLSQTTHFPLLCADSEMRSEGT